MVRIQLPFFLKICFFIKLKIKECKRRILMNNVKIKDICNVLLPDLVRVDKCDHTKRTINILFSVLDRDSLF